MKKNISKVQCIFMILFFLLPTISPILGITGESETKEDISRTTLITAQWEDEKQSQNIIVKGKVAKENFDNTNSEIIDLKGATFENISQEKDLVGVVSGSYTLENNKVILNLKKESQGDFTLNLQVTNDSLKDSKEIEISLGAQVLTVPIKISESNNGSTTDGKETDKKVGKNISENKVVGNLPEKARGEFLGIKPFLSSYSTNNFPWEIIKNSKTSDPSTDGLKDMNFSNIPGVDDGRIWTDKTVRSELGGLADNQFEVTLSALGQSAPVRTGYQIPADTVFTIDLSGSMTTVDSGADRSRIALLVDSLNEAIDILQDANPKNRIAVVAYGGVTGGYARVENVLSLGRYTSTNGAFFGMSGSSRVNVIAQPVQGSGGDVAEKSLAVSGSTPTQWGIREASRILENVNDRVTEVPVTNSDGTSGSPVTVTRRPNLILMTDGEPTMGRADFAFDSSDPVPVGATGGVITAASGDFYGDGNYGEQGLAVMTALTAAYRKKAVFNHFFPNGQVQGTASDQPKADVGFFSISLGNQSSQAAQNLINATLNPVTANTDLVSPNIRHEMGLTGAMAGPNESEPTMTDLLTDFINKGATGNFLAQFRNSFNNYQWNNIKSTINIFNNSPIELKASDIPYANKFFKADDSQTLRDSFISITNHIQDISNNAIVDGDGSGNDLGAGTLDFSDVLGEYMKFDGLSNIEFPSPSGGTFTYNISDIDAHRNEFVKTLTQQIRHPELANSSFISSTEAEDILNNRPDGIITYYTDTDGRYIGIDSSLEATAATKVELYPVWGAVESQASGTTENVSSLLFSVHTALRDITFRSDYGTGSTDERKLKTKDQFVHWSIPANLIPERTVLEDKTVEGNTSPIRARFNVSLDENRLDEDFRTGKILPTSFYSNSWIQDSNASFATFEPSKTNPFYTPNGDRVIAKSENRTATDSYSSKQTCTEDPTDPNGHIAINLLGNNGTFSLNYMGRLRIEKEFDFLDKDGNRVNPDGSIPDNVKLEPLIFEIVSPDGVMRSITFDPSEFVLENGKYVFNLQENLTPGTYKVTEKGGEVVSPNYVHLPGGGTQEIKIMPETIGTASFVNTYTQSSDVTPALRIMKFFHGLPEGTYPENFEILLEGPVGSGNPQPNSPLGTWTENVTTHRWETHISLKDAISGTIFTGIKEGTYTLKELNEENTQNTDYGLSRNTWNCKETVDGNILSQGEGKDSVDITVSKETDDISFRFDNFYEHLGSLELTKSFEGVPVRTIPENFYITVTNENNEEVGRLNKADILNHSILRIDKLIPGRYTITEHNYEIENLEQVSIATLNGDNLASNGSPNQYDFYVTGAQEESKAVISITNRYTVNPPTPPISPTYQLQLTKVDQYGNCLAGAQFELQFYDGSLGKWKTIIKNLKSDRNGLVEYGVTEPGKYRFLETKAPTGYKIAKNPYSEERTVTSGVKTPVLFGEMKNQLIEQIQLSKTDSSGKPLAGAIFKVEYKHDGLWQIVAKGLTSDQNGLVSFNVDKGGDYRFVETKAPDGYAIDTTPKEVIVTMGEKAVFEAGTLKNKRKDPTQPNKQNSVIKLMKVDGENHPLADAIFKVEMYNAKKHRWEIFVDNLQSGADGKITLNVQTSGRYRFVEVKAPKGYNLNKDPKEVTVNVETSDVVDAGKLVNYLKADLPIVGEKSELVLLCVGLLLILSTFSIYIKNKINKP